MEIKLIESWSRALESTQNRRSCVLRALWGPTPWSCEKAISSDCESERTENDHHKIVQS